MKSARPTIASANQVFESGPPSVADTCSGDGSFTITANAAPNLDGCFKETGSSTEVYTVSGTATQSEVAVLALEDEGGNVSRVAPIIVENKHILSVGVFKLTLLASTSVCSVRRDAGECVEP